VPSFGVRVEGENCRIPVSRRPLSLGRLLGGRDNAQEEVRGFITTRFIEADSADDAGRAALRLVREQLAPMLRNPASDPPRLTVTDVWQSESQYADASPGSGFTFY
jgi:hypothetical protein